MCTSVSERIILCTCTVANIKSLKHYWKLHRHDPASGVSLVGMTYMGGLFQKPDPHNPVLLCNKLNEGNLFDKPMTFSEKDRLEISFQFKDFDEPITYGFEYQSGSWRVIEYDFFTWKYEHVEKTSGKIKNAIKQ